MLCLRFFGLYVGHNNKMPKEDRKEYFRTLGLDNCSSESKFYTLSWRTVIGDKFERVELQNFSVGTCVGFRAYVSSLPELVDKNWRLELLIGPLLILDLWLNFQMKLSEHTRSFHFNSILIRWVKID